MFGMFYYTSKSARLFITYSFASIVLFIIFGVLIIFSINIFKIWWLLIIVFLVSRHFGRYAYFLFFGVNCINLEFQNDSVVDFNLLVQYDKKLYLVDGEYFGEPINNIKLRALLFKNIEDQKYFKRLLINRLIQVDSFGIGSKPLDINFTSINNEEVSVNLKDVYRV